MEKTHTEKGKKRMKKINIDFSDGKTWEWEFTHTGELYYIMLSN